MAYEYNPLIKDCLQKKAAVSPEDLKNKVPKIKVSIDEIEIGEIGQKQNGSTADMTEGFFYKRGEGQPIEYEDVTIPIGAKKIIYTNKFDASQKIVYSFDNITLPSSTMINYSQEGRVFLLNDNVHTLIKTDPNWDFIIRNQSLIPSNIRNLMYCQSIYLSDYINNLFAIPNHGTINEISQGYKFVNDIIISGGFRLAVDSVATIGRVVDFIVSIAIPIKKGDTESYSYRSCVASDLLAVNWILTDYISQLYPLTPSSDVFAYDDTRPCYFYNADWVIIESDNNKYILRTYGGAGQGASEFYETVSDDGENTRYIDPHHLECVFDSEPKSTSSAWAQAIDIDLYFNYTATIEDTTDAITIHRKIPQYDENGFPLVNKPAIERIDTQPSLDPNDFATADQGAKADTALQGIIHGTDGNYVTSTIGAKDANSEQSVSVSLTLQPIATAGSGAKGVAEASDVKDYIGNNTATKAQGTAADTALQQLVHGADGLYVTTTVTQKANNEQTIYIALTLQDIATASESAKGLLEAWNARNYIDTQVYNVSLNFFFYGVQWDENDPSPDCTRIGNMSLHAELPIQNAIIGGLLQDDLTFTPFTNQSDWSGETVDGSAGQLMLQIPKHYFKSEINGTIHKKLISQYPLAGFIEIPMMYVSAEKATVDRTDPNTPKLCSVVNTTAAFRGGNNTADWDGTYRSLLGFPASNISLTNFRQYARNRAAGTAWNCYAYHAHRALYWLFVTEYATLNSQKPYNAAKDNNGYAQGGLGPGVSNWNGDAWNAYNGYNPLIPCGYMLEYGNRSAVKNYSVKDADDNMLVTFEVNSYRGIQSPFADIWDWADGILINVQSDAAGGVSTCYVTDDPAKFSSTDFSQYREVGGVPRTENWIKTIYDGEAGDIICKSIPGSSTSYYCDYYWGLNLPASGVSLRGVRFGGHASSGAPCGFLFASSNYVPGSVPPIIGSRLCAFPSP